MASRFWVGGTGTCDGVDTSHISATSGGASGASFPGPADTFTFDAASGGGTVSMATSLNIVSLAMGAFTGTLDFSTNGTSHNMGVFSNTGSGTRTLTLGASIFNLSGSNGTVWNFTTTTGLTYDPGTSTVNLTYAGGTGTRVVSGLSAAPVYNLNVLAGTDTVNINTGGSMILGVMNWTGFSGTWSAGGSFVFRGNVIFSPTMTAASSTNGVTFAPTSGSTTVTTNGIQINRAIAINCPGASVQLADNLDMGGAALRAFTLTAGTFDKNNQNITSGSFSSSNTNVRSMTLGSGMWTLTGTGTVWNMTTATNMTFDGGTTTIVINDASSSSKTFAGNAMTYYNLLLTGAGTGTFVLGVSTVTTTFNNITVDTPPHTVQVFAGKILAASSLTWSGTLGNLNTFQSTTSGTTWFISVSSGVVSEDYISLQDSWASGGATFYAGNASIDAGNNMGWIFTDVPPTSGNAQRDENHVPSWLGTAEEDGRTTLLLRANPANHALSVENATTGQSVGGNVAPRDQNHVPAFMAVSSVDGVTPVLVFIDGDTGKLLIDSN